MLALAAAMGTLSLAAAPPAQAGKAWDEIRAGVFAGRTINPAGDAVTLAAPFRPLDQRAVLPGALLAAVLWELAKYAFAWSLHYFHYDQIYGSVGAVVAVLTWSYVSSLIMLFGAQLTAVFHREHPAAEKHE
jgi:hypothetical protein